MGETEKEKSDRQLIELLNELRVALPGRPGATCISPDGTVPSALHANH